MEFALPFPNVSALSLNSRLHWARKAKLKREARTEAWALAANAFAHSPVPSERPLPVRITFHAPDRRKRDRDNLIGAFKSYADGIADAIGVDDAEWEPTYAQGEVIKGGCVIVSIGETA